MRHILTAALIFVAGTLFAQANDTKQLEATIAKVMQDAVVEPSSAVSDNANIPEDGKSTDQTEDDEKNDTKEGEPEAS